MDFEGSITFTIIDDCKLDYQFIENNILIKPTTIIRKGQDISLGKKAPYNIWMHEIEIKDQKVVSDVLVNLLDQFISQKSILMEFIEQVKNVKISIFMQSLGTRVKFRIDHAVLVKMQELGISLDISFFIWGDSLDPNR